MAPIYHSNFCFITSDTCTSATPTPPPSHLSFSAGVANPFPVVLEFTVTLGLSPSTLPLETHLYLPRHLPLAGFRIQYQVHHLFGQRRGKDIIPINRARQKRRTSM